MLLHLPLLALACSPGTPVPPSGATLQSTLVVDATGARPGSFLEIQDAVEAASDGQTILVAPGIYLPFQIEGMGINVIADSESPVLIRGAGANFRGVEINGVPADSQVVVRGFEIQAFYDLPPFLGYGPGLEVTNCGGGVWIEDCAVVATGPELTTVGGGASVINSDAVHLIRSTFEGENGGNAFIPGSKDALYIEGSRVALHASTAAGGTGGYSDCAFFGGCGVGLPGGDGVQIHDSTVAILDSVVLGGLGSDGTNVGQCGLLADGGDGGSGGNGMQVFGTTSVVWTRTSFFLGAPAGQGESQCSTGLPGEAQLIWGGSVTPLEAAPRSLEAPALVRVGEPAVLRYVGQPGDLVTLTYGLNTDWGLDLGQTGIWALEQPVLNLPPLGTAGPDGTLETTVVNTNPFLTMTVRLQAVALDGSGGALSTPTASTLLRPAL